MDLTILNLKSQCSTDNMEALDSCRTRIDHQHIVSLRITNHLQNMGMSAYEYVRLITVYQLSGPWVVSSRISADMGHEDLHSLALEEPVERVVETQCMIVTVACHTDQWLESGNLLRQVHASAKVSGMPYLIDRRKEFLEPVVKNPMGVRYESYIHVRKFNISFCLSERSEESFA